MLGRLQDRGWMVLHDLAVPGSQAKIDHLLIGLGGMVVIDSKQYRRRLQLDPERAAVAQPPPAGPVLRGVRFEAEQAAQVLAAPRVAVVPIVAVHGAPVHGTRWS